MDINLRTPDEVIIDMQKCCSLRNDWDIICRKLHEWYDEFLAWGAHQRKEAREEGKEEMRKLLQETSAKTYTGYCPENP